MNACDRASTRLHCGHACVLAAWPIGKRWAYDSLNSIHVPAMLCAHDCTVQALLADTDGAAARPARNAKGARRRRASACTCIGLGRRHGWAPPQGNYLHIQDVVPSRADFPLPVLGAKLDAMLDAVVAGRGFAILRCPPLPASRVKRRAKAGTRRRCARQTAGTCACTAQRCRRMPCCAGCLAAQHAGRERTAEGAGSSSPAARCGAGACRWSGTRARRSSSRTGASACTGVRATPTRAPSALAAHIPLPSVQARLAAPRPGPPVCMSSEHSGHARCPALRAPPV